MQIFKRDEGTNVLLKKKMSLQCFTKQLMQICLVCDTFCICRFHGKDCAFSEAGNAETFEIGYLSGVGLTPTYSVNDIQIFCAFSFALSSTKIQHFGTNFVYSSATAKMCLYVIVFLATMLLTPIFFVKKLMKRGKI